MDIEEPSISSVNKLLQRRVEKHPDHIIVTVPDREFKYSKYTFSQLDQAVSKLTAHLVVTRPWVSQLPAEKESRAVGFLSKSGFHFAVHELALIRLGWTVLFLSPNNSPPALEYLLRRTRCRKIIVHSQLGDVAAQTQVLLARSSEDVSLESYAESTIWETEEHVASYPPRLSAEEESPNVAFIFHSSGSTGYPKPIFITHAASIHNFANNFDMNGLITLPLYHVRNLPVPLILTKKPRLMDIPASFAVSTL